MPYKVLACEEKYLGSNFTNKCDVHDLSPTNVGKKKFEFANRSNLSHAEPV
jgi:hypothetical protein